jgi:hypothetical protein
MKMNRSQPSKETMKSILTLIRPAAEKRQREIEETKKDKTEIKQIKNQPTGNELASNKKTSRKS